MLLAQCGRGLLRQAVEAPPETRPLPLRRRPPGRHQPLPRRDQRRTEALHMDRRPRQDHRRPSDEGHQALDYIHWTRGVPSI